MAKVLKLRTTPSWLFIYIGLETLCEIFDQSIADGKLKALLIMDGPANTAVIQGWKEASGIGMKIAACVN